jgi:hypothetical protein
MTVAGTSVAGAGSEPQDQSNAQAARERSERMERR